MRSISKLLRTQLIGKTTGAKILQAALTAVGVFTFIAGTLYLPSLSPTRIEAIIVLLLLGIMALACTAVGQLAVIVESLRRRNENH
jgi:hypothetical protein